ncbi:MAG: hypothetical protein ACOYD9_02510 [Pyramidobacter sp.]|jgi:epoxyqueuosine reductase QueG
MGVLREELKSHLLNSGAVLVGFGTLNDARLPYPALPRVVSWAVKLEPQGDSQWDFARAYFEADQKTAFLAEHVKAILRRYGFKAESPSESEIKSENPDVEFPDQAAAEAAGLAARDALGLLSTARYGRNVRFGTVFTDATWKKNKENETEK